MDSKKQSKLPPGIGSKIMKALQSQTPSQETNQAEPASEVYQQPQEAQFMNDNHGLETKSHMDFGSQEMFYDEVPGPLEATDIPDLESINSYNEMPQYGSFEIPDEDSLIPQNNGMLSANQYNQQSYEGFSYEETAYEETGYTQEEYQPIEYNQPIASEADFEQQIPQEFSYDQQSYEEFDEEYDTEEIEEYQTPHLGEPEVEAYEDITPQANQNMYTQQEYDQQEYSYESVEEDSGYEEYSEYEETPYQTSYSSYDEQQYEKVEEYDQYEELEEQEEEQLHEVQPLGMKDNIQIGYSQQDLEDEYQQGSYENNYEVNYNEVEEEQAEPVSIIDLDAVEITSEADYEEESIAHEPQAPAYEPLDIDSYTPPQQAEETREAAQAPPVMPQEPQEEYYYQQPVERVMREPEPAQYSRPQEPQETYHYQQPAAQIEPHPQMRQEIYRAPNQYQEPVKEYRPMEERIYQEPQQEYYNTQEPAYREPQRDYYKPQDINYREPVRDYYKAQEPAYREPQREYYKPQEPAYREPQRDYSYERAYTPEPRRVRPEESMHQRSNEMLSPNVETLIKLVSTLPHGVTKQTGAQIIKQTMEAMGISMNEVLTDAQNAQSHMQKNMNDCYDKIEESKRVIRQLDDDIYNYQCKTKELNDLMSLFVYTDNETRRR
ncbi:MAG: hypothetical protein AB7V50_00520 [Vampirovibrionia bacterium]